MNFVRSFFAPTLVLATTVALAAAATACKKDKPDGTNPPDGNTGGSVAGSGGGDGGGGDGGGADGGGADGGGAGDGGGEKPKSCEAKTADAPTPLFGEQVFIRPPVNVTLAEENPTMAVGHVSGGFVSACDATVDRMTVLVFEHDKAKTPKDFAAEFIDHYLHKGGYTGGTKSDPIVDTKTDYDISVEYPAQGGAPASVLYIAVKQRHKNFFAIVYQTRPDEYPVLKPTFQASAGTLLVKPPS